MRSKPPRRASGPRSRPSATAPVENLASVVKVKIGIGRHVHVEMGAQRASACTSIADRLPVPSSIMSAVVAASPSNPSKSAADPIGRTSMNVTAGRLRCSADQSDRWFGSCDLCMRAKRSDGDSPTLGSRDRSIFCRGAPTPAPRSSLMTPPPGSSSAGPATTFPWAPRSTPCGCACGDASAPRDANRQR